jgi:hypothetical protein
MDESMDKLIVMCFVYFVFYILTSSGSNDENSDTKNSNDEGKEPQLDIDRSSDKTKSHAEKNKDSSDCTVIYFQEHFDLVFSNKFKPLTKIYINNSTVHVKKFSSKKCSYCICLN